MANSVRLSTSILVIAIPVYIFTSWLLEKDLANNHERRELKLRKWLTYFTLFISAITIIIDLIMFVFNFLSGELTIQFF
jgi:SNF family Na+-dependent transporter